MGLHLHRGRMGSVLKFCLNLKMINPKETILAAGGRRSGFTAAFITTFKHWFLHNVEFEPEVWRILNEEKIESIFITQRSDPDGKMKLKCFINFGYYDLYETELLPKGNFELPKELLNKDE